MKKLFGNAVVFVILYVLLMLPTYYLPYLGSNSAVIGGLGQIAAGVQDAGPLAGINPAFWLHLGALVLLMVITWFRGAVVNKQWLIIFPILAAVFDLAPALNFIPLVPTVMHLLAIILGVAGTTGTVPAAQHGT